jgi:hypothetical protein
MNLLKLLKPILLLVSLSLSIHTMGQDYKVDLKLSFWTDTTTHKELVPIVKLYKNYLESRPDSIYDNPYWNSNEKTNFENFDFISSAIFNPGTSSAKSLFKKFSVNLLNIEKKDSVYIIQAMYYSNLLANDSVYAPFNPIAIVRLAAIKENNDFKLANAYPYLTENWFHKKGQSINYHFPKQEYYSDSLNTLNEEFIAKLCSLFNFKTPNNIEIFAVDGVHELGKLLGYDYYIYGYASGRAINNLILSGNKSVYYPHEIAHQVLPKNKQRNHLLEEGFATYYGGTGGVPYQQKVKEFSKKYTDLKLSFETAATGEQLNNYPLGAIIVDIMVNDFGYKKTALLLQSSTLSNDELFTEIQKLTGLNKQQFIKKIDRLIEINSK